MLAIESAAEFSEIVTGMEYHSHQPYASSTYKNNDEIRIPISQQDIITAPFESYLHIAGKVSGKKADNSVGGVKLVSNAMAFLFDSIRYEIGGVEIDRTKNVGITTTVKSLLSVRKDEEMSNTCWFGPGGSSTDAVTDFTYSVPLRLLLGFAEDYKKIVVNVKQELILLRTASDNNAVLADNGTVVTLTITKLYWRVPHITVSDTYRLKLLKMVERDTAVHLPFRSWELHEYPVLPQTKSQSWTVKTSSELEKPRYVVLAFQTNRKDSVKSNMAGFDGCSVTNVKLYLNSQYYPYDNINGDTSIFYEMFARFRKSYYESSVNTAVDFATFKNTTPLYVIDCSKQNDSIKSGPVDVRLEFEASQNIAADTTAYCLLLHDSHLVYTMLTGTVSRMTS